MKTPLPLYLIILLLPFIGFSQNSTILPQGVYKTYDDFINKKATKLNKPFIIKNKFGSAIYILKDSLQSKVKDNYFAVVQNDSILIRVNALQERFKNNKKVFFASKDFDYNLALFNNDSKIYLEQGNVSKSWKYIRVGYGYFKGIIFDFDTSNFNIFMKYKDIQSYLTSINRLDLLEYITEKKVLDITEIRKSMIKYFGVKL